MARRSASESRWERLADRPGGDVAGLAMASTDGGPITFAGRGVGVYQSTDGGQSWALAATGASVPFAEVVAPSPRFAQDRTLFVCAADGVYRSSDAGESWAPVLVGSRMFSVAPAADSGGDGTTVLAGTDTDGVLRSEDSGRSWTGANAGLVDLTVIALALSPGFAADRTGFAGTASGLYRTRNGARSWREVDTGLDDPAVQCVAVSPNFGEDGLVLAGTEADGLLRSTDGGATWEVPPSLAGRSITALAFGAPGQRTVAAATEEGVAVSHDEGETWQINSPEPNEVLSLISVTAADGAETLLAGLHRHGVVRSADDGAATWRIQSTEFKNAAIIALAVSPAYKHDRTIFVATTTVDEVVVWRSTSGGQRWHEWLVEPGRSDTLALALSPNYDEVELVFVGLGGRVLKPLAHAREVRSGKRRPVWRGTAVGEGALGVTALGTSPTFAEDRTLFAATNAGVFVSRDSGDTYEPWSEGLNPVRTVALGTSPSYADDRLVYALGLGGTVWRRGDDATRPGSR